MVTRRLTARPGLSLVEAIVALTLLAIGLLGALATQVMAARLLREAEARASAINLAGAILDSLAAVPNPSPGERRDNRYLARWSTTPANELARIEIEIEYHDGTARRELRFEILHAPPPPRLGEGQ